MKSSLVRALRGVLGLTQEGLAKLLGVTRETVARWETDERRMSAPTSRLLQRFVAEKELGLAIPRGWRITDTSLSAGGLLVVTVTRTVSSKSGVQDLARSLPDPWRVFRRAPSPSGETRVDLIREEEQGHG